jgi:Domain of unknown function (DUF4394)
VRKTHRLAAIGALAVLTVTLTACGAAEQPVAAPVEPAAGAGTVAAESSGRRAVGLTADGELVGFDTANPGGATVIGPVGGLQGDTALVGIDYRVQDGKLYGVGNKGGIYTIDDAGGAATKVRKLTVALKGKSFGVDFNPAANALRIISDTGQNLRQPFATADAETAVDKALTDPAAPPATGTVPASGVTAAGYTNNDLDDTTATTLFDLNSTADRLAVQSPANAGTLAPAGKLPVDAGGDAGFDVYSTLDAGRTVANDAFAVVTVGGAQRLLAVDVLTGGATDLGQFNAKVTDVAIRLQQ